MKWFKHDSNAHRDTKLKKVIMKYKAEGYALYWYCIELIASRLDSGNISFELEDDAEIIAYDLGIDTIRVQEIMLYMVQLNLFTLNPETERIVCLKLANRLDESASKNPEIRKYVNHAREQGWIEAKSKGFVYLLKSSEKYKIGMTTSLHKRLSDIKTINPDAVLMHTIESVDPNLLESTLHKFFKDLRVEGEWFSLSEEEVDMILSIQDGDRFIREGFRNDSGGSCNHSGADKIRLDKTRLEDKDIKSESKIPPCPHEKIIDLYHEILPELTSVTKSLWKGSARANNLQGRWKQNQEFQKLDFWQWFFSSLRNEPFYMGENDRNWKPDLAWMVTRANFEKLVERFINAQQ